MVHWRCISEDGALSKILASDWINHMSVIFIDMLLQPFTLKPTHDADESDAGQTRTEILIGSPLLSAIETPPTKSES